MEQFFAWLKYWIAEIMAMAEDAMALLNEIR